MPYYVVRNYWPAPLYADIHEVRKPGARDVYAVSGQPLPKELPTLSVTVGTLEHLPAFFRASIYLLMNQTAIEAVRRSGEHRFELRPVTVTGIIGGVDECSYQHVHPLDLVECLDISKSVVDLSEWDGTIEQIHRLVLDESRIPTDRHLFQLKEFPVLLGSDRLREEFFRAGIPTVVLQPVSEYDSQMPYWPD